MKKLLAVILSVICIFSCFALPASAAAGGAMLGELASTFFEKLLGTDIKQEDTSIGYGVIYEIDSLSGVSVVYKPSPSISFENPGIYTITSDTPLSIDYKFICWEDSKGKRYYPYDKIYVDGTVTLYAVWVEKDDNDVRVARIIKTTMEAFKRLIGKFFGIIDIVVNFEPTERNPGAYDLSLSEIYYEDTDFSVTEGNERVILYIDSYGFKEEFRRIEKKAGDKYDVKISLCTGWNIETTKPVCPAEYPTENNEFTYSFTELMGPLGEDVLVLPTCFGEDSDKTDVVRDYLGKEEVKEYFEENPYENKIYMTVTINDSLYNASKEETGMDYDEFCNPVSVVFTLTK